MASKTGPRSNENLFKIVYNLKSENSYILKKMLDKKKDFEKEKEGLSKEIVDAKTKYDALAKDKACASEGLSLAEDFFKFYRENESLKHYFELLNVNFDPSDAEKAVENERHNNSLGLSIENDMNNLTSIIEELENKSVDCEIRITEQEEKVEDYEHTRLGLSSLIEDVLNGNNSYNRDYVENILNNLINVCGEEILTKEEIVLVDSLILFPELGLSEFNTKFENREIDIAIEDTAEEPEKEEIEETSEPTDSYYNNQPSSTTNSIFEDNQEDNSSTAPIIEESKEVGVFAPLVEEDQVEEEPKKEEVEENTEKQESKEEVTNIYSNPDKEIIPIAEVTEEMANKNENEEEPPTYESTNSAEQSLEEYLTSLGVNPNSFNYKEKAMNILNSTKRETINRNIEELKIINCEDKIYEIKNDYMYLSDLELPQKINLLRSKMLKDETIKKIINENTLAETTLQDLENRIKAIEEKEKNITEENYLLLKYDASKYFDAIKYLASLEMEPDEKEAKYYTICLVKNAKKIPVNTEILKDYGISIYRRNGKHELGIYWKKPLELLNSIDDIIEVGEEDLLNTTPEVLAINAKNVVKKINYCKSNNIEYVEKENSGSYQGFIYKTGTFTKEFGKINLPDLISYEDNNNSLKEAVGTKEETVSKLLEILNNQYVDYRNNKIDLTNEENNYYEKITAFLENNIQVQMIGKNTYYLEKEYISRNKFARNLTYLIKDLNKSGQNIDEIKKEIIFVAMLYNSRKPLESIVKISEKIFTAVDNNTNNETED